MPALVIPRGQLDALPLSSSAVPGTVTEANGQLARYFSPADLGLSNATVTVGALGYRMLFTPYLDLRACNRCTMTLRTRNPAAARIAFNTSGEYMQMRMGAADAPAFPYVNAGAANFDNSAAIAIGGALSFAATAAANELQTISLTWAWEKPAGVSNAAIFGANQRIIWVFSTVALPGGDGSNLFTATLEASS